MRRNDPELRRLRPFHVSEPPRLLHDAGCMARNASASAAVGVQLIG